MSPNLAINAVLARPSALARSAGLAVISPL
jgi:hypothetical protein